MSRQRDVCAWWHWPLCVGVVLIFALFACTAWFWVEVYRARIWAAELRKAGVAAPVEVR